MTSIIEQADAIVGINPDSTSLDAKAKGWMRRGAYIDWFIHYPARSVHEMRVPSIAHNTIEDLAAEIVHLHDWFDVDEYRATDPDAVRSRRDLQDAIDACTEAGDFVEDDQ